MLTLINILLLLLNVAWWFAVAHIIMSWLINFGVLNMNQPIVGQLWDGLNRILEPVYSRIRNVLPATGALDLAPLVFLLGIIIAQMILGDAARSVAF
ncbi:MAG: YggT family protein [Jannaschia helgolandensis]|jgi:YggT family protein|uniref:YggT family protein n=1 Tax=Jannaschia helgolandensis TaxID=188906 RepID=A0A1H7FYH3_9RHOB|nr:YggT family protein [Jannaschia helgolandensis]SEK30941.1 YggT family protein [Jannaschia helgolandensis]